MSVALGLCLVLWTCCFVEASLRTVTKSEVQFLVFIAYDEQFSILLPKELCGKGITRELY